MSILIKNGRVLDPGSGIDAIKDIYIENGEIREAGNAETIIDATGLWVTPGLIDMHVHLRDPGWPDKETIASGTAAAAAGGFTTICSMANTDPATDSPEVVEYILKEKALVHVIPIGSVTKSLQGKELSPFAPMKAAGICAISDDGKSIEDPAIFKAALEQAAALGLPVLSHAIDENQMNEPEIIARDIALAKETGVQLHICHVSTEAGLTHIKAGGVTTEVCPHHFTLTQDDAIDTNHKMSPPLRSKKDVEAMKQGLKDGTITVIATDHAPHHEDDKNLPYDQAANGIIGLETAVPLCITELSFLSPLELIAKLTINPAKILNLDKGNLTPGKMADITIIDPNHHYTIDKHSFKSKSRNTPFHGREVRGKVVYTIVEGRVVYDNR
ncbi:MAG: dihydroorotase [Defluviitaleaceae bacterium]|nr:dihydroorotase [Defluviitaleaceae bacterium]